VFSSSIRRAGGRTLIAALPAALIMIGLPASAGNAPEAASAATEADQSGATQSNQQRTRMRKTAAKPRRFFLDSPRKARFDFELGGNQRRTLVVKVKKLSDGKTRKRWRLKNVRPGETQRVRWNGRHRKGGFTGQGRHVFKVYEPGKGLTDMSDAKGKKRFRFYKHRFPIRARHTFGDGYGAGRGHQGADVFARCGAKLRAVRGGRVKVRGRHSAAGNYLVIAGRATGQDYVYMHMQRRNLPKKGARVRTGEVIGHVGETGNASGCHLHFEMWSAPGWYEGGKPYRNVMKRLKRWGSWS
jgi:murein DD-endopeptidase MepM/ murein hydrolase activator NlpD